MGNKKSGRKGRCRGGITLKNYVIESLLSCPIIAAVKDMEQLERVLRLDNEIIFILFGTICDISTIVARAKEKGKIVFVHVDLIAGLGAKRIAADFICNETRADGIISTQPAILKRARELGMTTVLRLFLLDSKSLENVGKQIATAEPEIVEIMPGIMPGIIKVISQQVFAPIITGGLIFQKEDVIQALSSGAVAVSTSKESIWPC